MSESEKKSIVMIKTRDELIKVDLRKVVYVESEGNYCRIMFINGVNIMILSSLSKLAPLFNKLREDEFCRLGKRHLIHKQMVFSCNIPKQQMILTDLSSPKVHTITTSKEALKEYRDNFLNTNK